MGVKVVKGKLIKKIICMALVVMMLMNNLVVPITIIAQDLNNEMEQTGSVVSEEMNLEATSSEEGESSEDTGINKTQEENLQIEETKEEENSKKDTLSKETSKVAVAKDYASIIKELESKIKPREKKDVEVKEKNDEYEINSFVTQFVSGAKEDANGNLVWTPANSAKGHEFSFRVNYAISGLKELPAGAIQITIPKSILRNREGNLDDYFVMSVPKGEEYDGTTEFAYMEDEEYLIVYNPEEVEAGINGYFEIAYATDSETFEYKDYDKENTKAILDGGTASDPFYAIITVNLGDDTLANVSDDEQVYIDTTAKIVSTQKRYPNIYRSWDALWMKEIPEDSNKYYYLVWEIRTYVQKDPTQKYNFTLNDVIKDLTPGLDGKDYEIVGYKMSGEKYYSDKNTQENITLEGYRYDYVLTRHKIETYKEIDYLLKNTITAIVDPIDQLDEDTKAVSSNTFSWDADFKGPAGHFGLSKWGNNNWYDRFEYYWDYANYDLDKFQSGETDTLKGLKYFTETVGYAYPWTLKEGGSLENPEDYGVNPVTYETWDDSLYLEGDENPMKTEDYYLDYLIYSIINLDAKHDEFENKFVTIAANYEEDEDIIFYGKFNGSEDWIEVGRYNLATKKSTIDEKYVETITENKVKFKAGVNCTGWKSETTNKHYYTYIVVQPYFVLTHSKYVDEKIQNKDSIKIKNNLSTRIKDYTGKTILEGESSAIDYVRVTYYDSDITKKVAAISNNVLDKINTITWKVNAWETATSGSGIAEYIKQDSGIFYDLIPLGGEVDLETVQVQTEKRYLEENEYSYEIITNYKNSGRTLLIVKINEQAEHYTVYYNTVHSWDSIKDYGRNVLNPVAYETGNEKITNGYADNGGNLSTGNKSLFTNLDETTNDKKFIYVEQTYDINAVTAVISGLYKKVKSAEETTYTYETEVKPEGDYSYQLRYQNTFINKAKNLVFFDSLENFEIKDSEAGTTKTSGWKGTLKSVDLSQLTKKGIDAKLYVSTVKNLNLEQNNNIKDTKVWKKASQDTDLSKVTAIAIDMTKATDGSDYILPAGESVSAVVYMEAPAEVTKEVEENPYTYNNIYMQNTLIDMLGQTQDFFIHQDYTKVKYHVIADVNFYKVNEENEEETIKGITFRLYGTSNYGTKIDEYVASDKNGKVRFKDIEAGEYILQEYEGTPDWLEDHTEHRVKITSNREVYIDEKIVTEEEPVKITNKPRIHTDVEFTKRDLVTKGVVEGAKFKLSGTSKYGNEILMYATSKSNGEVEFKDLEYGTYDMVETETADRYVLGDDKYRVIVDENGNYDVLLKNAETKNYETVYNKGKYDVYNEPLHSLRIVKRDEYSDKAIEGAKFKLFGVSDYGNNYDKEIESTIAGFVDFTELEAGTYILQETYVPEVTDSEGNTISYILDKTKYAVEIKKDGTATIKGIERNENGNFVVYNRRNKGQITITKKWVDDKENSERPEPTIYISTEKPEEARFQYFRNNYNYANGPLYYIDSNYKTKVTGAFGRNTTLSEQEVVALGAKRLDREYDNPDAEYKIYGWIDENGNSWWWSNAEVAVMTNNSNRMFYEMSNVKTIDTTDINTSKVTDMSYMFERCRSLSELDLSSFDTVNVTNMGAMFEDCNAIKSINVSDFNTSKVTNMGNMFNSCNSLTELDVSAFDTSKVTNMGLMFRSCNKLTTLDVSNFDTSNTTNMVQMFQHCGALKSIDVSEFNTSKVTNMAYMFQNCSSLTELEISGFDTSEVTNMAYMFGNCSSLKELDVSNFYTSKVTNMSYMFNYCSGLTKLDVSNWDTSKVTNMTFMFHSCESLKELDVTNFETSNVTDMRDMFSYCNSLTELDVSEFDTSKVTNMNAMFNGCSSLKELNVSGLDTSKVTNMGWMFNNCGSLTELDVSGFKTSNVTVMEAMFWNCSGLTELNVSNFNTSKVTNMGNMFNSCNSLTEVDVSNFDTSNVTNMGSMFFGCSTLKKLDVSNFDTSNVTNMYGMFDACSSLINLDVSNFKTSKVTNMSYMFKGCNSLIELDVSGFNTSNVTNMTSMFWECGRLKELDVSKFDTSKVTYTVQMFMDCSSLTALDVSNFDTSNVTNMASMFFGCSTLKNLDVSEFDTSKVTNMIQMFTDCSSLTALDVSNFDTSKVTNIGSIFSGCSGLTELNVSNFDTSNVTNMYAVFARCSKLKTIYASENFVTTQVTNSNSMFMGSSALVGGNGTRYNSSYQDKTYARIDKPGQPGYFTDKAPTVSLVTNEEQAKTFALNEIVKTNFEPIIIKEKVNLKINNYIATEISETESTEPTVLTYSTADTNYDDEGNEVTWVKNGDVWTYTFYVDDPNATWYVWEENMEGYETNYTPYFPGTVENQHATITNIKTDTDTSAAYREPIVGDGSLKITKTLIDRNGNITLTKEEDNTEFTFTVKLTAKKGQESLIRGTQVFGDYIFKDGIGTVKLRAGETVLIDNLPIGTTYNVTEKSIDGYEIFAGSTGTITYNNVSEVKVTNYKKQTVEATTNITLNKKVTGNYEKEEDFKFEISFNNLKPNTKYNLSNGMSFVSNKDGNADVSVTLKNGESVTVKDIPVGSKYKVYEYAGNYTSTYMITDANGLGLINNTADTNTKENTALSTKLETADEGEEVTIVFINDKNVKQNLKLEKQVTSEADKNSYMFTIQFANLEPNSTFNSTVGRVKADTKGTAELTIYLAGGEEAEFYNIPVGTTYKITELASSAIASYIIIDKNTENKIVSAGDSNTINKMALSTEEETINENEEAVVTFINDIVNQEEDRVEVSLGAIKTVLDISGKVLEDCKETFEFEITPENEENPMPENKEIKIKGNGTASFGTITFTKTGTYKYKVTEKAGKLDYYDYDKTEYEITYEVTNPEGLLQIEKTIKKDGFIVDAITFTNKISKVDVKIEKIDEQGNPLKGATLQIKDEQGNVVEEWETTKETYTTKLPVGTYTLHEEKAPKGYNLAKDIKFAVNENGETIVNEEMLEKIIMKDTKIKEETTNKPDTPSKEENNKADSANKQENTGTNVSTGDNIVYYFIAMIVSGIIMIIAVKKKY